MSIARRIALLFRVKANKTLDRAEDPREVMDYSYERQLEMLTKVRRGIADVATSRKRLDLQLNQLQQAADKLESQARQAVAAGADELAREALTRRSAVLTEYGSVQAQRQSLQAEEARLTTAAQRLQARVEAFRTRKETIKATYTAAEAQARVGEAVSGISEEMGDVGMAMQRAEDKTAQMQSRAAAVDELIDSGVLGDATLPAGGRDEIQTALDAARGNIDVEQQLAALKAGGQPAAVGPAESDSPAIGSGPASGSGAPSGSERRGPPSGSERRGQP